MILCAMLILMLTMEKWFVATRQLQIVAGDWEKTNGTTEAEKNIQQQKQQTGVKLNSIWHYSSHEIKSPL